MDIKKEIEELERDIKELKKVGYRAYPSIATLNELKRFEKLIEELKEEFDRTDQGKMAFVSEEIFEKINKLFYSEL